MPNGKKKRIHIQKEKHPCVLHMKLITIGHIHHYLKGGPGSAVLLPCDHVVMDSSPRNKLLQKCRERLLT
jgi:hypothetical protein